MAAVGNLPMAGLWLMCIADASQSAEKTKLAIGRQTATKRAAICLAAQSLLTRAQTDAGAPNDKFLLWAQRMLLKNRNLAAVAVAAKLARIAWRSKPRVRAYIQDPHANVQNEWHARDRKWLESTRP